ncbi:hypothetical protein AALO_G00299120 [Alosa alosa]|uniref:G-protein coupled receptors family 1 profile domain-containing protein n=1 Tax=Alosa alosa TaxID=278164 RepID=A0AAV6FEB6_9TELE|nr:odorant receptor 131-2 [Alosa alosa]KAG5261023.1 hypothetical protein AALO_G00299120 [Alosa alosa]
MEANTPNFNNVSYNQFNGTMKLSNETKVNDYIYVRVCVSAVAFIILAFFNIVINCIILRQERLRNHARFVLVFHLLLSALIYFAVCWGFNLQIYLKARLKASTCATVITVLTTSASNILLTLTVMAVDRYWAICFPLRYSNLCARKWPWLLGLLTWALAAIIPLTLFPWTERGDSNRLCGRAALKKGELHKIVLITICFVIILYSYARICLEGRRLGVLNRRNKIGCRTIAWHGLQLAVYILPNFISFLLYILLKYEHIHQDAKDLFAVVNFAFFSIAQCIAPIVYGLRKEEILEQLNQNGLCFSCPLKTFVEWTVRLTEPCHHSYSRERRLTSQTLLSLEPLRAPV